MRFKYEGVANVARVYDREFTSMLDGRVRRRVGYSTYRGDVTRFVVQLEYRRAGSWDVIVRFDHDPESDVAHDVTNEGVHLDVYRDGEKYRSEEVFPPMPADDACTFAEEHMRNHYQRYVRRYEQWHGIENR